MVLFNYATKEITAKVVYYGPGLCGKTTNLQFIYDSHPTNNKSSAEVDSVGCRRSVQEISPARKKSAIKS